MLTGHRVSGYDFVRAMTFAGFRLLGATFGRAVLVKGDRDLLVPQRDSLGDRELLDLLQKAGIAPAEFRALLHRLGSRDTMPAVRLEQPPAEPVPRRS